MSSKIIVFLVLARQNPALPPKGRSVDRAVSKMATAAVATTIWLLSPREQLARDMLECASPIFSRCLPLVRERVLCARLVMGSARRYAADGGGYWALAEAAIRRLLLTEGKPRQEMEERAHLWALAYPLTAEAVSAMRWASSADNLDDLVSAARNAALSEWDLAERHATSAEQGFKTIEPL